MCQHRGPWKWFRFLFPFNLLALSLRNDLPGVGNESEGDSLEGNHRGWFFPGSFPHSLPSNQQVQPPKPKTQKATHTHTHTHTPPQKEKEKEEVPSFGTNPPPPNKSYELPSPPFWVQSLSQHSPQKNKRTSDPRPFPPFPPPFWNNPSPCPGSPRPGRCRGWAP